MPRRVCVVGAGVVGLSTAVQIQAGVRDVTVTIVTEHVTPNTTSDVSGGFWEPYLLGDNPKEKLRKWSGETFQHISSLSRSEDASVTGAFLQSGYTLFREEQEDPWWRDLCLSYRHLNKKELDSFPGHKFGYFMTTATCDCRKYLSWLMTRFQNKGGVVIRRKIKHFHELQPDFDLVVNCAGMGARELCHDQSMVPTQGQVMRVHAPWVKHFVLTMEDAYILLGSDHVLLGGTGKVGQSGRTVDLFEKERIFRDCCKLIPSLKHSRHLSDWVGLRPTRPTVRLERETIVCGNNNLQVVHNYGHGGAGVTLHWGCGREACQLVREALDGTTRAARL